MKKYILIFFLTLGLQTSLFSQCRLIPERIQDGAVITETFREPAFQIKNKGITCGISVGKIFYSKDKNYSFFIGVTLVTPANYLISMKNLALVPAGNREEDIILLEDIDGDGGTTIKGETGTLYVSRKYTVYLNQEEITSLIKSDLVGIGIIDKYDEGKIIAEKSPSKDFISSLIKCNMRD